MKREDAEKRGLSTKDPITGKQVPFTTWRVELTKEQEEQQKKDIEAKRIPF